MASVCLITPAFNEAENLHPLYERIRAVMEQIGEDWRWIIVDDNSQDGSYQVLCHLAEKDPRLGVIRLSRNCGSHEAIRCGLRFAKSDCVVLLAADLQDPPEIIPELIAKWSDGAEVVWAEREQSADVSRFYKFFAWVYYTLMRNILGMGRLAPRGADVVLLDAKVVDVLRDLREKNVSLFAMVAWLGFRQAKIYYQKEARLRGKSGWTAARLIKLVIDSITAFSYLPIRVITYLGMVVAILGFAYAGVVIFAALAGAPPTGWASLMVVVLVLSGLQMLMLGVLGEYLWRALDEARSRPSYVIASSIGLDAESTQPTSIFRAEPQAEHAVHAAELSLKARTRGARQALKDRSATIENGGARIRR